MVVHLINQYKEKYKLFMLEGKDYDELYKWEAMQTFQKNWDLEAEDFLGMYDKSFAKNKNLWSSANFYPKKVMIEFIKRDPEKVRIMFRELYDETSPIEIRIDRFVYKCDKMRDIIREEDDSFKKHYHDGFRMLSVYLSFKFPMTYAIYKYTEYKNFKALVESKKVPERNEISKFFNAMRIIHKMISKDEELMKIHAELRKDKKYYQDDSLLLAQDFYWCTRFDLDRFEISK